MKTIIENYYKGALTKVEALEALDKLQVRGDFSPMEFIGYDYKNQKWVEFPR
jgi:hypothetical protein